MMYLGDNPVGLATSIPVFSDKADIEYGEYIPETDILIYNGTLFIPHSIGTLPDFIIVTADIKPLESCATKYLGNLIYCRANDEAYHVYFRTTKSNSTNWLTSSGILDTTQIQEVEYISDSYFKLVGPQETYVKTNTIYHYTVGKFKEVTPSA